MIGARSFATPKWVTDRSGDCVSEGSSGNPRAQDVTLGDPIATDDGSGSHQAMSANLRSMARKYYAPPTRVTTVTASETATMEAGGAAVPSIAQRKSSM